MSKQREPKNGGTAEALRELDHGGYRRAVERPDGRGIVGRQPGAELWRAEVLLYLDRLEEAAAMVDRVRALPPGGADWIRASLINAEIAHEQGEIDTAEELLQEALTSREIHDHPSLLARARLRMARIAHLRQQPMLSLEGLLVARQLAQQTGNAYVEGQIASGRAACWFALGKEAETETCHQEAIELLSRAEGLRRHAAAKLEYAAFLSEIGRHDEALSLATAAERTASEIGIQRDLVRAVECAARALVGLGRYAEAVERTGMVLDRPQTSRRPGAEIPALKIRAEAAFALGHFDLASSAAETARARAEASGDEGDVFDARLLAARARAKAREQSAVAELRSLKGEADASGSERRRLESRLYLAEALTGVSPLEAEVLCAEAKAFALASADRHLRAELGRVERLVETAPLRQEGEGIFTVDVRSQWPSLKSAREALERFLITKAVDECGGNLAAAGRLLGESRFQMHYLWKQMHDESARERAAADGKRPRTRRPRNLFSDRRKSE